MDDLSIWLEAHGLGQYAEVFAENDVDAEVLHELTDADLSSLGISLGHRRKLQKLLRDSRNEPVPDDPNLGMPSRPSGAEHRQLTVLFCDLADSTSISKRLEVEAFRDFILRYQAACERAIHRFGGYVARVFGDGLLVYFGYPVATEDDAERAARAALAIVEAVEEMETSESGARARTRIGIATGPVLVGDVIGSGASQESAVLGDTPNLAARLQGLAHTGSTVISAQTRELLGRGFQTEALGAHQLKGIDEPVLAWRLVRALEGPSRFERTRSQSRNELIGRREELELLRNRWAQAANGEGQVVYVSGEPGIGKSRLLDAFRAELDPSCYIPLTYQCSPFHESTPLHPVVVQLCHAAGIGADDDGSEKRKKLRTLLSGEAAAVARTVALLSHLLDISTESDETRHEPAAQRKEQTLLALRDQLTSLQSERPIVLFFEDVHWIDPTTAELLELCVEWAARHRALLLITHRPEYRETSTGEAHVSTVHLRKLSPSLSSDLVGGISGVPLPDAVIHEIVAKSDGIPLFVEELTRAVMESDSINAGEHAYVVDRSLDALVVPSTLQASLTARLDRLGNAREVAQVGAVIGREFTRSLLAECISRDDDQLDADIQRLETSGLISARGSGARRTYLFKHALVQESAYESLLSSRRASIHRKVAAALSALADASSELLAFHLSRCGELEQAIDQWHRAASAAIAKSAMREALAHISKATEALAELPPTRARRERMLDLMIEKVTPTLAVESHSSPSLETIFHDARPLYEELGNTPKMFPLLYAHWAYLFTSGSIGSSVANAREFLNAATRQDEPEIEAVGHRLLGTSLIWSGEPAEGVSSLELALGMIDEPAADRIGFRFGQDVRVASLCYQALGAGSLGDLESGLRVAEDALERADRLRHALTIGYAYGHMGILYAAVGHREGLDRCIEKSEQILAREAMAAFDASTIALRGLADLDDGNQTAGCATLEQALVHAERISFRLWRCFWLTRLTAGYLATGDLARAEAALGRGLEHVASGDGGWCEGELLRMQARLAIARGAPAEQIASAFDKAFSVTRAQPNRIFELSLAVDWVEFCRGTPDARRAMEALERTAEMAKGAPKARVYATARALLQSVP